MSDRCDVNGLFGWIVVIINYLWFVTGDLGIDRCEHGSRFAAGYSEINANIGFQSHASALQRCVHSQMDWIVAFSGIILMDNRAVVGDFMSSCPPA